jgi:hypothetical protein
VTNVTSPYSKKIFQNPSHRKKSLLHPSPETRKTARRAMKMTAGTDLGNVLKVAQEAVLSVGNEIRHGMLASASASASIKSDSTDLVTESDQKCEEIITRHVLYEFPTEEKTVIMNSTMTRPVRSTRLVTPIKKYCVFISHSLFSSSFATDGTANFCPKNTFGMRLVGLLH